MEDEEKATRLNALLKTVSQIGIDQAKAGVGGQKYIEDARVGHFQRRLSATVTWGVGGVLALTGAGMWVFWIYHGLEGTHLPVPRAVVAGLGTVGLPCTWWIASFVVRTIRARPARLSVATGRAAVPDTVVPLPSSRQGQQPTGEQGADPTQADVS